MARIYDEFSIRMKEYEKTNATYFPKRMPILVRVDGKAFHTYTKDMKKPFDEELSNAMIEAAKYMCKTITGCKLAYTQSDEITLLIINYNPFKMNTEAYYNNSKSKIESITASKATVGFNQYMSKLYPDKEWAEFDSRAWVLPKEEVANAFIWRQMDATKNSVAMVAQSEFTQERLNKLNGKEMQELLWQEKGINWSKLPTWQKRGSVIIKQPYQKDVQRPGKEPFQVTRYNWDVDHSAPEFTKEREYIEQFVYPEKFVQKRSTKLP